MPVRTKLLLKTYNIIIIFWIFYIFSKCFIIQEIKKVKNKKCFKIIQLDLNKQKPRYNFLVNLFANNYIWFHVQNVKMFIII